MSAPLKRIELEDRKRMIVVQADLHRALLQAELVRVRARLDRLDEARERFRAAGPWLAVAGAVGGVIAARKWRSLAAWAPPMLAAWRWLRSFRRL